MVSVVEVLLCDFGILRVGEIVRRRFGERVVRYG